MCVEKSEVAPRRLRNGTAVIVYGAAALRNVSQCPGNALSLRKECSIATLGLIFSVGLRFLSASPPFHSMLHSRPETLKFNQLATIYHLKYPKCEEIHYELIKQICIITISPSITTGRQWLRTQTRITTLKLKRKSILQRLCIKQAISHFRSLAYTFGTQRRRVVHPSLTR